MRRRAALARRLPVTALEPIRRVRIRWLRSRIRRHGCVTNELGVKLFIDPDDPRALRLARNKGATNSSLVRLWRRLVEELEPAIVLDVGANYGEVAFATTYPAHTTLHLVEANPRLVPLLRQTVQQSQLGNEASIHACAASDHTGTVSLHVSEGSSGTSSVIASAEADGALQVPACTLDSLVESHRGSNLLFKIDVEGYELPVLRGMSRLLSDHPYAGIVEAWPGSESELISQHDVYLIERGTLSLHAVDAEALGRHLHHFREDRAYMRDVLLKRRAT